MFSSHRPPLIAIGETHRCTRTRCAAKSAASPERRAERKLQAEGESIEYAGEIALLEDQVGRLRALLRAQQEERISCLDLLGVVRPDESIRLPEVLRDQLSTLIGKCVKADARAEQLRASLERTRAQEDALRARVQELESESRELRKMELVAVGMARARAQVGAGTGAATDRPAQKRGIMRVTELAPTGYVAQVHAAYGNLELVRCSHNSCPDVLTCERCFPCDHYH